MCNQLNLVLNKKIDKFYKKLKKISSKKTFETLFDNIYNIEKNLSKIYNDYVKSLNNDRLILEYEEIITLNTMFKEKDLLYNLKLVFFIACHTRQNQSFYLNESFIYIDKIKKMSNNFENLSNEEDEIIDCVFYGYFLFPHLLRAQVNGREETNYLDNLYQSSVLIKNKIIVDNVLNVFNNDKNNMSKYIENIVSRTVFYLFANNFKEKINKSTGGCKFIDIDYVTIISSITLKSIDTINFCNINIKDKKFIEKIFKFYKLNIHLFYYVNSCFEEKQNKNQLLSNYLTFINNYIINNEIFSKDDILVYESKEECTLLYKKIKNDTNKCKINELLISHINNYDNVTIEEYIDSTIVELKEAIEHHKKNEINNQITLCDKWYLNEKYLLFINKDKLCYDYKQTAIFPIFSFLPNFENIKKVKNAELWYKKQPEINKNIDFLISPESFCCFFKPLSEIIIDFKEFNKYQEIKKFDNKIPDDFFFENNLDISKEEWPNFSNFIKTTLEQFIIGNISSFIQENLLSDFKDCKKLEKLFIQNSKYFLSQQLFIKQICKDIENSNYLSANQTLLTQIEGFIKTNFFYGKSEKSTIDQYQTNSFSSYFNQHLINYIPLDLWIILQNILINPAGLNLRNDECH